MNTASNTANSSSIIIEAPAKLTLSLRVTGVREDGFHLIDAEMVTLDLADTLTITPGGNGISVDGPFGDGVAFRPASESERLTKLLESVATPSPNGPSTEIPFPPGVMVNVSAKSSVTISASMR